MKLLKLSPILVLLAFPNVSKAQSKGIIETDYLKHATELMIQGAKCDTLLEEKEMQYKERTKQYNYIKAQNDTNKAVSQVQAKVISESKKEYAKMKKKRNNWRKVALFEIAKDCLLALGVYFYIK